VYHLGCCLLEIFFLPFELIIDLIFDGWFSVMAWIIPEKHFGKAATIILKVIVGIFSCALLTIFLIGVFGALFTEATIIDLWQWIFIPLGFSLVQIGLGIIVRINTRKKQ